MKKRLFLKETLPVISVKKISAKNRHQSDGQEKVPKPYQPMSDKRNKTIPIETNIQPERNLNVTRFPCG